MKAWNLTRSDAVYRHASFSAGLRAAGYEIGSGTPRGRPGDVLLIWSRYGAYHEQATRFEAAGGVVVVAENGYLTPGGGSPHAQKDRQWYALALDGHNGQGRIPEGGPERWNALGIDLKPWRTVGEHILVCPNRSFGIPGRMMPPNWANDVCARLRKLTKRKITLRPHPGNSPPRKALAEDLAGAWAVVIWSSSAGVHSLIAGVPVICEAPAWICKDAALTMADIAFAGDSHYLEDPSELRDHAMQRLAWGQWHIGEIEDGTAFRALLKGKI